METRGHRGWKDAAAKEFDRAREPWTTQDDAVGKMCCTTARSGQVVVPAGSRVPSQLEVGVLKLP